MVEQEVQSAIIVCVVAALILIGARVVLWYVVFQEEQELLERVEASHLDVVKK